MYTICIDLCINVNKYISRFQYPEFCPTMGCEKRLGPQEVTKYLEHDEFIRFEAFALLRSGQMNRKKLGWCSNCRLVYSVGNKDELSCIKCRDSGYSFQEALSFLDLDKDNPQYEQRKLLDEDFLRDCKGIVDRCLICLKRKYRIHGYRYSVCICNKISNTINCKDSALKNCDKESSINICNADEQIESKEKDDNLEIKINNRTGISEGITLDDGGDESIDEYDFENEEEEINTFRKTIAKLPKDSSTIRTS